MIMARKSLSVILALLLALSVFSAVPALAASIKTTVKTTNPGDTLNVRKGPHKGNTPVVGYVKNGHAITLIDWEDEDDPESWSKIRVSSTGAVGYLKNKYIKYFGLSNRSGEIDPDEDDDYDYSDADDNDGKTGSGSSGSSGGSSLGIVVTNNGGSVNVRKSASTSSAKVTTAYTGEYLTILGSSGSFYKVRTSSGKVGYIYKTYVDEGIPGHVSAGVNLRKGAGTGYGVIRTLRAGTSVRVYAKSGKWSRVKTGSTYGWVYSEYVKYE